MVDLDRQICFEQTLDYPEQEWRKQRGSIECDLDKGKHPTLHGTLHFRNNVYYSTYYEVPEIL